MALFDELSNRLTEPGSLSRRSFLGRAAKTAFALAAAVAGVALPIQAYACNCQLHAVRCCHLCYYTICSWCQAYSDKSWCATQGPNDYDWTCYDGVHTYNCIECNYDCCSCAAFYGGPIAPGAPGASGAAAGTPRAA
jgi:hypothetical protein